MTVWDLTGRSRSLRHSPMLHVVGDWIGTIMVASSHNPWITSASLSATLIPRSYSTMGRGRGLLNVLKLPKAWRTSSTSILSGTFGDRQGNVIQGSLTNSSRSLVMNTLVNEPNDAVSWVIWIPYSRLKVEWYQTRREDLLTCKLSHSSAKDRNASSIKSVSWSRVR